MGKLEADPLPLHHQFFSSALPLPDNYLPWHGHVTALTVAPQYRRMGLAKTLTEMLERGCEDADAWFVDLFVREGNAAVGTYRKMGYVSIFFLFILFRVSIEFGALYFTMSSIDSVGV